VGGRESRSNAALAATPHPNPSPEGEGLSLATQAERAARLCKADLVTGMVGEFPELQGLMGGYYARAQGEDDAVADAIRDHYKPVGQGDDVPTAPVTVAVSLADKLDTLMGFFHPAVALQPTGSRDPFALRRAALSIISLIESNGLRASLQEMLRKHEPYIKRSTDAADFAQKQKQLPGGDIMHASGATGERALVRYVDNLLGFFADRLKVQQREAGVRHDLIDAVFALGGEDDLVRLLARVHALQAFVGTPDGASLLAGYKRAANILKKEGFTPVGSPANAGAQGQVDAGDPGFLPAQQHGLSYTPEKAEADLHAALDSAEPAAAAAIAREDFAAAMAALASLRAPIDAFFDTVTVNDPDQNKRRARLALLERVRVAVHGVADFSRVEG
jgi:glycyl-tRNA synthetase beta chain